MGYRVVIASDMSGANLLDLLGSIEANQITLAEDELDDIHEDPDKLRIYKVGYDNTGAVPRTLDGNTTNRNARFYYPFCFKIYAAEESPDVKKLEGFNDRAFKLNTMKGSPTVYVKKLSEKTDSKKYNDVISKINYLRKLTLVYRLIHHGDIIEQVNTNIEGRALELTEPQIRLFNSDKLASPDKAVLNRDVLPVLSACLRRRGEIANKTLEAIVYQALNELLPAADKKALLDTVIDANSNNNNTNHALKVLSNQQIYEHVYSLADGSPIADKQYAFYSVEYGEVSEKKILKICRDKFLAKDARNKKERSLEFDEDIVSKVGMAFDIVSQIEILKPETQEDQDYDDGDNEVWFGWRNGDNDNNNGCNSKNSGTDNDNDGHTPIEESTSQSVTEIRKIGHMEDKGPVNDKTQQTAYTSQNNVPDIGVNSMEYGDKNIYDLDKNGAIGQNIAQSEPSAETVAQQSNEQNNNQKYALIPENNTISVTPSPNENKKDVEESYTAVSEPCQSAQDSTPNYNSHTSVGDIADIFPGTTLRSLQEE